MPTIGPIYHYNIDFESQLEQSSRYVRVCYYLGDIVLKWLSFSKVNANIFFSSVKDSDSKLSHK
jgi:hypothetical protein